MYSNMTYYMLEARRVEVAISRVLLPFLLLFAAAAPGKKNISLDLVQDDSIDAAHDS